MGALYSRGRQTDALAVYRQLHRRLVEERGVEPSEAAQSLHRQVLAHDPVLAPQRDGNLLRRVTSFVGRDEQLPQVAAAMRAAPLVTLTGVGGVGKARLALEVATGPARAFPTGHGCASSPRCTSPAR